MKATVTKAMDVLRIRQFRMTWLLASLTLLIGVHPWVVISEGSVLDQALLDALTIFVLIACLNAGFSVSMPWWVWLLALIPAFTTQTVNYLPLYKAEYDVGRITLMHAAMIVYLSITMFVILGHVLRGGRVTFDEISGAVCVYLLAGVAAAYAFSLFNMHVPGTFDFVAAEQQQVSSATGAALESNATTHSSGDGSSEFDRQHHRNIHGQLLYFSLVTLTTLGYGDITPQRLEAQIFAALLAVFGQVYLAVLVARLVGQHLAGGRASATADRERESRAFGQREGPR